LAAPHPALGLIVAPRQVGRLDMQAGDLLALRGAPGAEPAQLAAFGDCGETALSALSVLGGGSVTPSTCDLSPMTGWIAGQGGGAAAVDFAPLALDEEDVLVLRATAACTVWIANPSTAERLAFGEGPGEIVAEVKRADTSAMLLPPPLGPVLQEFTVPSGTAHAYHLNMGDIVQIIDVYGQQCSDFMAFRTRGLDLGHEVMIDGTVTRTIVGRAYPAPGLADKFYDADMRPLLAVVQDTVGRHDTFALACTARGYEERGFPGHLNCSDNISQAMAPHGVAARAAWPAVNFFFNSWIDSGDNQLRSEEAWSRPGDYVAMRALDDLTCVTTACPDDIDPINGWNPTDIHVRIYNPNARPRRAIAYRTREDAPMSISRESAFHHCTSRLTQDFAPVRTLWAPRSYQGIGTRAEYWACRNAVTVQDMSGLRKFDIVGPDAAQLLQECMTRNIEKLPVWRGSYMLMCDEQGQVVDDGTLFRIGEQLFRWCCGSEESARRLTAHAAQRGYHVRVRALGDGLPNLAVQGPRSRDLLSRLVFTSAHVPRLHDLKWFGVTLARLHDREGAPFMLSRSGYTGELGYELFCDASDAKALWEALFSVGEDLGVTPMGSSALETIRIEAGLAAAGAEFSPGVDAFEAGLGFSVDLSKSAFVGKAALERNASAPRRVLVGLNLDGTDVPAHGATVWNGERPVGAVTSATNSPVLGHAIAIARVAVEFSGSGTALEIGQMDGRMKRLSAATTKVPFIDPRRDRARA
jgi:aminomethyltransferase